MFKFLDKFKRKQLEKAANAKESKARQRAQAAPAKSVKSKKAAREMKSNPWGRVLRPVISEKATVLGGVGQYVFSVYKNTSKVSVRQAVEDLYGVKVVKVNIINQKGRQVAFGKTRGKQKDWKKAVVMLNKGEKIELYK